MSEICPFLLVNTQVVQNLHDKGMYMPWEGKYLVLYRGKPYESMALTGEYMLRKISIFSSPNIKLPEGSKQQALTDRRL